MHKCSNVQLFSKDPGYICIFVNDQICGSKFAMYYCTILQHKDRVTKARGRKIKKVRLLQYIYLKIHVHYKMFYLSGPNTHLVRDAMHLHIF